MKKYLYVFVSMLITITFFFNAKTFAYAQQHDKNKITVNGTGIVSVLPDTAIITIGIKTTNKEVNLAQSENSQKFNELVQILKQFNIEENNIKTITYNIMPEYDFVNKEYSFNGYTVNNIIQLKTKDLQNLGLLVTQLVQANANVLNEINFTVEDENSLYLQALEKALQNATEKVKSVIGNSDFVVEEICELNNFTTYPIAHSAYDTLKTNEIATFYSGEYQIIANVKVIISY